MDTPATKTSGTGSLVLAGTGITSIAHITLETLAHIKEADAVYYLVTDPVTESFIHDNTKTTPFDLGVFYDKDKPRYDTYVQMCEVMLKDVRNGKSVLGLFYGHPGVFVFPSHRAVAIAHDEGYPARMLPGVSAEDCMFADLGFDPAIHGCLTYEATELLLKQKRLDPTAHNIIWQVGAIGVTNTDFKSSKFSLLVDRLEQDFGPTHTVVHYVAAVLPQSTPVVNEFTISDLHKEEVVKKLNPVSTFYIPPRDISVSSRTMAEKLNIPGMPRVGNIYDYPPLKWGRPRPTTATAYGPHEREVVAQLSTHVVPQQHHVLRTSPAMSKFITDLALSPTRLAEYKADPSSLVNQAQGLTEQEKTALGLAHPGPIYAAMWATSQDVAEGKERTTEEITAAVEAYQMGASRLGVVLVLVSATWVIVVVA